MRGLHVACFLSAIGVALIGGCSTQSPDDMATVAPTSGAPTAGSEMDANPAASNAITSGSASNSASGSRVYQEQQPGALRR